MAPWPASLRSRRKRHLGGAHTCAARMCGIAGSAQRDIFPLTMRDDYAPPTAGRIYALLPLHYNP